MTGVAPSRGLADLTVADVVVRLPKTLPASARLSDARRALEDPHVHMVLLTEAGRLVGTLVREDLPASAESTTPALAHAVLLGRTVPAGLAAEDARRLLLTEGRRRAAVVDEDGMLLGLLCLKRRRTGFCSDDDVAGRAAQRLG